MKTFFFSFFLTFSFSFGFSNSNTSDVNECPAPTNIAIVAQASGSVSFDWDDGVDNTEYRVYYEQGGQTSPEYLTANSHISFSGLPAGNYRFYFYTACGGTASSIIIDDVVIG